MVDIIIGATRPIQPPAPGKKQPSLNMVEAELLHVRLPRQRMGKRPGGERRRQFRQDPPNGKVLTILVPDGMQLPSDLDPSRYRILLRLVKK